MDKLKSILKKVKEKLKQVTGGVSERLKSKKEDEELFPEESSFPLDQEEAEPVIPEKNYGAPEETEISMVDAEFPEVFTPETLEDLLWLLRKTPKNVLSDEEREIIITAMTFNERKVSEVMLPLDKITFVHENDFLGPLTLDRLYKSGASHFPVKDGRGEIVGVLHTESLNSLEIKDTDRAKKYLDREVFYMRDDYTLEMAMAAFLRTNCYFFLVINRHGAIVGMMSFEELLKLLLGRLPADGFKGDGNRSAVAAR